MKILNDELGADYPMLWMQEFVRGISYMPVASGVWGRVKHVLPTTEIMDKLNETFE